MKKLPIFYNALMLTGVNLLLRLVSTSFQVFISGRIGAAGVGLLQLVMSVASMTMTAGMAGVRTAAMYLTAEALGRGRRGHVTWILSGCFAYSLLFSLTVGAGVFAFAPQIARHWLGDLRTVEAIRLFAVFLPVSCLVGVMVGYFTAAKRIRTLAAVEVAEQLCSMAVTSGALLLWAGDDLRRACESVVLGGCAGSVLTLSCLVLLRWKEHAPTAKRIPVARRLGEIAIPLGLADDLKVGINTLENLMVPKRLQLYAGQAGALSQFGMVCGMVFPVVMFPAAILFGLADLLIPEMARCSAAGSHQRIRYLARRSLRVAMIYGAVCGGILYLLADPLCRGLYRSTEAGEYLRWYALLIPMLYCDLVVDAMNKGLGKQRICVVYNIGTALLDVAGLYVLLPQWGMRGYFVSFFLSHAVNAALSIRLLLKSAGIRIRLWVPMMVIGCMALGIWMTEYVGNSWWNVPVFLILLVFGLIFTGVLRREDGRWLRGLIGISKTRKKQDLFEKSV